MNEKQRSTGPSDRVKSILRHIQQQNDHFSASSCVFHFNQPCFTLLNNFDQQRFHCLYANRSVLWRAYSITKSCDIPEHFYDLILLQQQLGSQYVLPFAGHFRESSGYTIGMFRQPIDLYPPSKIQRAAFKETVYALIVFLCGVCHRLGGSTPNMKHFIFVYAVDHPVLCDIGSANADKRERLSHNEEYFNKKKWSRFMRRKTTRDVIRYMRVVFPGYFQKKRVGRRCILNETEEECFDHETHRLVCQSEKKCLLEVIAEFIHLMPNSEVKCRVIESWIESLNTEH